jgi:hypothetical protein
VAVDVEDGENINSTQLGQHPQQMERTFGAFCLLLSTLPLRLVSGIKNNFQNN